MSAVPNLLAELARLGVAIKAEGGDLVLRAPSPLPPELVARLRAVKAELLAAISGSRPPQTKPEPEGAAWDASDWRAFYDERAGIREYDGQRPRAEAERLAWGETLNEWHRAHGVPPPAWQCAGCGQPLSGAPVMDIWDGARVHDVAGHACLIKYGKRWRATAAKALAEMGVTPPGERDNGAS